MVYIKEVDVSKNELDRIGDRIYEGTHTNEELSIISDYRAEHSKILKSFNDTIKGKLKAMYSYKYICSQRLKRLPSIISKIKRFKDMRLSRMQDLAGIRVILNNLKDVEDFKNIVKNELYKAPNNKNNFIFVREKDYIKEPKTDGYRSVHQVYKYKGNRYKNLNGYFLELQIRTKLQHQWATALEIIDVIKTENLKGGEGKEYYKEFFKLSSKLIEYEELKKDIKEISEEIKKLKQIDAEYNILNDLRGVSVVTENIARFDKNEYLLLILDYDRKKIRPLPIQEKEISSDYLYYESKEKKNVVLVSVEDLKNLKKAYPNYFLDAGSFIRTIEKYIK